MKIKTAVPDGLERKSYGTAVFMIFADGLLYGLCVL